VRVPRVLREIEFGTRPEAVVDLMAHGGSVDEDVVHGGRDVEVKDLVVAEQVFVRLLPLVDGHVREVKFLKSYDS